MLDFLTSGLAQASKAPVSTGGGNQALVVIFNICLVLGVIAALAMSVIIFVTGKGDAMSGGGSVRTTYKGKSSFDDQMFTVTLYLGVSFMALMVACDVLLHWINKS